MDNVNHLLGGELGGQGLGRQTFHRIPKYLLDVEPRAKNSVITKN